MAWFDTVRHNVRRAGELVDGDSGTKDALLGLWLALDIVPDNHLDTYSSIPEEELEAAAKAMDLTAVFAPVQDPGTKGSAIRALVRDLGVRLRALELHLLELFDGTQSRTASSKLASFGDFQAYLVLTPPQMRVAKTKQSFRMRGLARCRLLPVRLLDYTVELIIPRDARGRLRRREAKQLQLGAGLFKNLEFNQVNVADVAGGFLIKDAYAPDQLEVIEHHLDQASSSNCAGVVYPELTIGPAALGEMTQRIRDGSWNTQGISIIVAGSRHQEVGPDVFNVATILDGYGGEITDHRKLYSFSDDGMVEAIDLGDTLHVVLLDDTLFAFGICLDYCNPRVDPPYLLLDVDLILVPSCGEEKTMQNHIERSSDVLRNMRTHSFVVQQYFTPQPPPEPPLGFVLARSERRAPTVSELATSEPWQVKTL